MSTTFTATYADLGGDVVRYYPTVSFKRQALYWNTGSGWKFSYCLNARGATTSFFHKSSTKTSETDYYVGSGKPDEATSTDNTLASSLIGMSFGSVDGVNGTQTSSVGTFSGQEIECYSRSVSVNSTSLGHVSTSSGKDYSSGFDCLSGYGNYYKNNASVNVTGAPTKISNAYPTTANSSAEFLGWWVDGEKVTSHETSGGYWLISTGNGISISPSYKEDVSVVCVFGTPHTVTFKSNGGTGSDYSASLHSGCATYTEETVPECGFTRTGMVFTGWNTAADGSGTSIDDCASSDDLAVLGSTVTLYAQWRKTSIYITNGNAAVGKISLYSSDSLVADESNGLIAVDGVVGKTYQVVATVSDEFYKAKGVLVDGEYKNPYDFTLETSVEASFLFEACPLYSIVLDNDSNKGSCTISPSADKNGKWLTRDVTFKVTAKTGYKFAGYNIINTDTGTAITTVVTDETEFKVNQLSNNIKVILGYELATFNVSVEIDEASEVGIQSVSASSTGDVEYGTDVTFSAVMKSGYSFSAWYWIRSGVKFSESNPVIRSINCDTTFIARAKVSVSATISYPDSSLPHDASVTLTGLTNGYVELGKSYTRTVNTGSWKFGGWYAATDTQFANPLPLEQNATEAPTAPVAIVARMVNALQKNGVAAYLHDYATGTSITPSNYSGIPVATNIGEDFVAGNSFWYFNIYGVQRVRISALPAIEVGGVSKAFNCWAKNVVTTDGTITFDVISRDQDMDVVVSQLDQPVHLIYGEPRKVNTTVTYASASDRSCGSVGVGDVGNEESGDRTVTVEEMQGKHITLTAKPNNGYRFAGWYTVPEAIGTPFATGATVSVLVTSERTFYALFASDPNAIYEWEGSKRNKMMTWKSKVYVATKPFNPTSVRIDTEGYNPVARLTVGMFSSPDSSPTAVATLENVRSQDPRRLPIRRCERYMQVEVQNDSEVDSIVVGTSMTGMLA